MNCRRLITSVIGIVYLLTAQLVVHAVAMHDINMMHGMDHGVATSHDCVHDLDTYHIQSDLSISEPETQHDSTSCITITKTASKTESTQLAAYAVTDSITYCPAHSTQIGTQEVIITVADYQPPGRSEFLNYHYGHGIVMHC